MMEAERTSGSTNLSFSSVPTTAHRTSDKIVIQLRVRHTYANRNAPRARTQRTVRRIGSFRVPSGTNVALTETRTRTWAAADGENRDYFRRGLRKRRTGNGPVDDANRRNV